MPDLGGLALGNGDGHIDAVSIERLHRRRDAHIVLAAVVVLPGQFLGHALDVELVVGFTLGQADVVEALGQLLGLDVLVADQRDLRDRRTFGHGDDQDVALTVQTNVLEEAGLVQGTQRVRGPRTIQPISLLHRQIGEHGTGGDALQSVNADVADDEVVGSQRRASGKCQQNGRDQLFHARKASGRIIVRKSHALCLSISLRGLDGGEVVPRNSTSG